MASSVQTKEPNHQTTPRRPKQSKTGSSEGGDFPCSKLRRSEACGAIPRQPSNAAGRQHPWVPASSSPRRLDGASPKASSEQCGWVSAVSSLACWGADGKARVENTLPCGTRPGGITWAHFFLGKMCHGEVLLVLGTPCSRLAQDLLGAPMPPASHPTKTPLQQLRVGSCSTTRWHPQLVLLDLTTNTPVQLSVTRPQTSPVTPSSDSDFSFGCLFSEAPCLPPPGRRSDGSQACSAAGLSQPVCAGCHQGLCPGPG